MLQADDFPLAHSLSSEQFIFNAAPTLGSNLLRVPDKNAFCRVRINKEEQNMVLHATWAQRQRWSRLPCSPRGSGISSKRRWGRLPNMLMRSKQPHQASVCWTFRSNACYLRSPLSMVSLMQSSGMARSSPDAARFHRTVVFVYAPICFQ